MLPKEEYLNMCHFNKVLKGEKKFLKEAEASTIRTMRIKPFTLDCARKFIREHPDLHPYFDDSLCGEVPNLKAKQDLYYIWRVIDTLYP
jgi:hypothetical protein